MKISEYIIRPDLPVPLDVIDKIQVYHANPMSLVRERLGFAIVVSKRSGYRPPEHEKENGRKLTSEHLFKPLKRPGSEKGLGAADYRTVDHKMADMAQLMCEITTYNRLVYYPDNRTPFIHADYRFLGGERQFFISSLSQWKHVTKKEFLHTIRANKKEQD